MNYDWTPTSLFYRQVHPSFRTDGGIPSSQAFNPTPKDEDKLSIDDAGKVSAEGSWRHFTGNLSFESAGTWAVSFGEVSECHDLELVSSPVVDEREPQKSNPAHCHIDFSGISSKGQKKRRAQQLAMKASARGCLFKVVD